LKTGGFALLLAWGSAAAVALLAGCAAAAGASDAAQMASASLASVQVADGVYMVQGAPGEVDAQTLGRIGNSGFIVGATGVLAIDTGTSYRHGVALLAEIRRVTDKPVRLALITHARQEFLFGATAFRERGIAISMQRQAASLMQSRCERCLKTLRQVLGDDAMLGTAMFKPDHEYEALHALDGRDTLDTRDTRDTRNAIGRPVRVLYFGHSSGPGDVAVLDVQSGVLFAGGLLDHLRIPDVQDSDLDHWTEALQALRTLPLKAIVPGHGPLAPPAAIDTTQRYLAQLRTRLMALLNAGTALSDVPDASALPEFARWDQYDTIHRRNASILFVRFEREQMFKQAGSEN
jgi:glyoxylase-like metal-dependent hydrolase (beta-lactamase superfamily II)